MTLRPAALLVISLLSATTPASAQTDVQKRLDDLDFERRVKALETGRQQAQGAPSATRSGWRQLATGMSPEQVRELLGEPNRINAGGLAVWHWKNGGDVTFINKRVTSWTEPR